MSALLTTLVSLVVLAVAYWKVNILLAQKGVPGGLTRGFMVFVIAMFFSICAGEATDWLVSGASTSFQMATN